MSIQIKWLNGGRFRRFELIELNFSALIAQLQKRVPSFRGSICYIDDQNDQIVVESDQDLFDMIGYFHQLGENLIRIQTEQQQPISSKVPENGLKNALSQQKEKVSIGESESAEEGSSKEHHMMKKGKNATPGHSPAVDKVEQDDFVEEEEGVAEWSNFGQQSSESAQSPSFVGDGGDFSHFSEANVIALSGIGMENANNIMAQRRKRRVRSAVIPCSDCGMLVANASTSLKSHVNLHHLKLPIYNCRLCGQMSTQLQKATIVRHIERAHPGRSCDEFDYNYPSFSSKIHHKLAECFPMRNSEFVGIS